MPFFPCFSAETQVKELVRHTTSRFLIVVVPHFSRGAKPWPLWINAVRDYIWTVLSYDDLGLLLKPTTQTYNLDLTQWLYASGAMLFAVIIVGVPFYLCWKRLRFQSIPWIEFVPALMGACGSIVPWNLGQSLGIALFQQIMSYRASSYAASVFTGVFEGFTQCTLGTLGECLFSASARQNCKEQPVKLLVKTLFAMTVGALPGAMWQIIFVACVEQNINVYLTAFCVMLAVGVMNYLVSSIEERVLYSSLAAESGSKSEVKNLLKGTRSAVEGIEQDIPDVVTVVEVESSSDSEAEQNPNLLTYNPAIFWNAEQGKEGACVVHRSHHAPA